MKLRIRHSTRYTYDQKVQLNIHEFYLIPLQRFYFRVLKSNWTVFPKPQGIHERINFENNPYFQAWFTGETNFLEIKGDFEIEVGEFNPYGFIIQPQPVFPFDQFSYPEEFRDYLKIYTKNTIKIKIKHTLLFHVFALFFNVYAIKFSSKTIKFM